MAYNKCLKQIVTYAYYAYHDDMRNAINALQVLDHRPRTC